MGEDYDVPDSDWQSLNDIKDMIKGHRYKDISEVKKHLEFLESIAGKMNRILESEQDRDVLDLDTPKFMAEVRKTYDLLFEIYEVMIEKLPKSHPEAKKRRRKSGLASFQKGDPAGV